MSKPKILFGTNNPNKLREIREMLSASYEVLSLADVGIQMDVEETEPTLAGNAILKAEAFAKAAGLPCFSDDSGLEVDALDGAPGVISARYAGLNCSSDDNIDKLLRELGDAHDRQARFRCVIAFHEAGHNECFEGKVEGNILFERQGNGGFGYDPIFQPTGYEISFAEFDSDEKNTISHRGIAVRKFVEYLLNRSA
ncbi:MAG: RdgB/HAM1 family non-canonical purine NTP pyrophosphatase [Bacteroidota bacterium]